MKGSAGGDDVVQTDYKGTESLQDVQDEQVVRKMNTVFSAQLTEQFLCRFLHWVRRSSASERDDAAMIFSYMSVCLVCLFFRNNSRIFVEKNRM